MGVFVMNSLKELIVKASKGGSQSAFCTYEGKNFTAELAKLKENTISSYMFIYENFNNFKVLQAVILYDNDFFTIVFEKENFSLKSTFEEFCLCQVTYEQFLYEMDEKYEIKGLISYL